MGAAKWTPEKKYGCSPPNAAQVVETDLVVGTAQSLVVYDIAPAETWADPVLVNIKRNMWVSSHVLSCVCRNMHAFDAAFQDSFVVRDTTALVRVNSFAVPADTVVGLPCNRDVVLSPIMIQTSPRLLQNETLHVSLRNQPCGVAMLNIAVVHMFCSLQVSIWIHGQKGYEFLRFFEAGVSTKS